MVFVTQLVYMSEPATLSPQKVKCNDTALVQRYLVSSVRFMKNGRPVAAVKTENRIGCCK